MCASAEPPSEARTRRRWFQFGLRGLLALVAVAALFCGFVGVRWYRDYLQRQALADVAEHQGVVARNKEGHVDRVYLAGPHIDDAALERLVPQLNHIWHLRELDLVSTAVTDRGIMHLPRLRLLKELYLYESQATPQGVERLQEAVPGLLIRQTLPTPVGTRMAVRKIYDHAILSVAFSPGGRSMAAGSADGTLRVWEIGTRRVKWTTAAHTEWLFAVAYSPDGRRLATGGGDNAIRIWDLEQRREIGSLTGHTADVHGLAFTPDGQALVSASDDRTLRIWDVGRMCQRFRMPGHTRSIPGLALRDDGRMVASASRDDTIRLWDVQTGRLVRVLKGHSGDVMSVAFDSRGRLASAGYDKTVRLWNTADGMLKRTLRGHTDWVFAVAMTPTGDVISGGGDGLRVWNADSGRLLHYDPAQKNISALRVSPAGMLLASASAEGNIGLRDPQSGELRTALWSRYGERGFEGLGVRMRSR